MEILEQSYFGNTPVIWIGAAALAIAVALVLLVVRRVVHGRLQAFAAKTTNTLDDLLAGTIGRTRPLFLLIVGLYAGAYILDLPDQIRELADRIVIIAVVLQCAIWGAHIAAEWISAQARKRMEEDAAGGTALSVLGTPVRGVIWALAALLILDNLGIDVTALIAGLGIGGIAVALAMQNVLGDLFASLSIVLDRPFVVGDYIVVGGQMGTVERIGLKTTRVRALSGEIIVFSNNDLLSSRIQNYKQMTERRGSFALGVTYQTPVDQIEAIPDMVREIIEAEPNTRFDRGHFTSFGPSSLDFEFVYYLTVPTFSVFRDAQQAINLAIMRRFETEKIEFAYPTQTLFIERGAEGGGASPA